MTHHVIAGFGIAGRAAARWLLRNAPGDRVTIIAGETAPFYPRHNLHHFLAGDIVEGELFDQRWSSSGTLNERLSILSGSEVTGIHTDRRLVRISDGRQIPYDRLLIATGSAANRPNWPGSELTGLFTLRTIEDARGILKTALPSKKAIIAGGGVLGLDTLYGLHRRGVQTTLLVREKTPGRPGLDEEPGLIVKNRLKRADVDVQYQKEIVSLEGQDGRLEQVLLASGERLAADLVVACVGSRADLGFLEGSGIVVNRGVSVRSDMGTNIESVFAAGDAAETLSRPHRIALTGAAWRTAEQQGEIAAAAMAGKELPSYRRTPAIVQGVYDLHYASIGDANASGDGVERVVESDPAREQYRRIILRNGAPVGALLLGDLEGVEEIEAIIFDGGPISYEKARELASRAGSTIVPLSKEDFDRHRAEKAVAIVDGKAYDLSASGLWHLGLHVGRHLAGQDLTEALRGAPHDAEVLRRYPLLGRLAAGSSARPRRIKVMQLASAALFAVTLWFFARLGLGL